MCVLRPSLVRRPASVRVVKGGLGEEEEGRGVMWRVRRLGDWAGCHWRVG